MLRYIALVNEFTYVGDTRRDSVSCFHGIADTQVFFCASGDVLPWLGLVTARSAGAPSHVGSAHEGRSHPARS
jgi:hypothetical protein